MSLVDIHVRIEGVTPLMMRRFTDEAQMEASAGSRRNSPAADRGTAYEQAEDSLYLNDNGEIIMPTDNIIGAFKNAGKYFKVGTSKLTTQRWSLIPVAVQLSDPWYPFEFKSPWYVDSRPVRMPSGGRILRHRPCFEEWAVEFDMELDTSEIGMRLMRQVVDLAGKKAGLCDYRPSTGGSHGRFVVTKWQRDDGEDILVEEEEAPRKRATRKKKA